MSPMATFHQLTAASATVSKEEEQTVPQKIEHYKGPKSRRDLLCSDFVTKDRKPEDCVLL